MISEVILNKYRDEAFQIAKEHGFHDEELSVEHFKCLVISELMEAVEADRKGQHANLEDYNDMLYKYNDFERAFEMDVKDTVEDELADACIRLLDLSGLAQTEICLLNINATYIDKESRFTENIYEVCFVLMNNHLPLDFCISTTLLYIIKLAEVLDIDICKHIELKMQYNRQRPYKHSKKY